MLLLDTLGMATPNGKGEVLRDFLRAALSVDIVRAAVKLSLVVGTVLNLVNQGPELSAGLQVDWMKVALNYIVPYCVATYSAARVRMRQATPAQPPGPDRDA